MRTIITGASSGIGAALVDLIAGRFQEGERPRLLLVDRDGEGLARTAARYGKHAKACVVDLSELDCGEIVAADAVAHMGGIDALVSNAGMLAPGLMSQIEPAVFDRTFAVNTRATWLLALACYPHLKRSSSASIVATASLAASNPAPNLGAYSASKAALLMLIRQLANEWGPDGIRCNTVSPGATVTAMNVAIYSDPDRARQRASTIPLRRLGAPKDVAEAILFLIGDGARQITGIDIPVDGGSTTTLMGAAAAEQSNSS
jgi:NAD(P)-dependent dehydrogenase (short-subunit alcohol dehydrogenase family)